MGTSKDERWLLITKIHPGSLAHAHSVLREGAKLLAITVDGVVHRNPEVNHAARLISEAVGEIRQALLLAPLPTLTLTLALALTLTLTRTLTLTLTLTQVPAPAPAERSGSFLKRGFSRKG